MTLAKTAGKVLFVASLVLASVHDGLMVQLLPNTTGIDGQLTANLKIDHFFSLWLVFNNDDVKISDDPFTIFAPQNTATKRAENLLQKPELVKQLLLDHVVLGTRMELTNIISDVTVTSLGGKTIRIRNVGKKLKANEANILEQKLIVPNARLIIVSNYLFPEEQLSIIKKNFSTSSHQASKLIDIGNIPLVTSTKEGTGHRNKNQLNTTFVENVMEVLSFLKSGVRVFQHFLSRSNVSRLLNEGQEYTVFVPTDHAFQRWHPIDWGFYPFSVPEFTEGVIVNHFINGRLKQESIKDGEVIKTLGGRDIVFKKTPSLTVNGASIVTGDTLVAKGNIMFIGEVLFVSESVVSKLHQQHKDKETPPLLAFPWFGAQFLSHAFLALERDKRFTHVTRFLNLADLAPHVSGTGYTFFVPSDTAFEELGLDKMPDNYLSTGDGLQILLNHFVKGRLYDKDLKNGTRLTTLGNQKILVKRDIEQVHINEATIVESEVFVYNLGTMFYVDKVLFANPSALPPPTSTTPSIAPEIKSSTSTVSVFLTSSNAEKVPEELVESSGSLPDVLFADGMVPAKELLETTTMPINVLLKNSNDSSSNK